MSVTAALEHVHEENTHIRVGSASMGKCDVCRTNAGGVRDFELTYYVFENDYDLHPQGPRSACFGAHVECWKMACAAKVAA